MPSLLKSVKKGVSRAKNAVEKKLNVDLDGDGVVGKKSGAQNREYFGSIGDTSQPQASAPVYYSFPNAQSNQGPDNSMNVARYDTGPTYYSFTGNGEPRNNEASLLHAPASAPASVPASAPPLVDRPTVDSVPTAPTAVSQHSTMFSSTASSQDGLASTLPYPNHSPSPGPNSQPSSAACPYPSAPQSRLPVPIPDLSTTSLQSSAAASHALKPASSSLKQNVSMNSAAPAATGGSSTFQVTIPANCYPGMTIRIQTPAGQMADVKIPPGCNPGSTIAVQLPNQSSNSTSSLNQTLKAWPEWRSFVQPVYRKPPLQLVQAPTNQPTVRPTGRKKALLVGINYFNTRAQLKGCINDVQRMKQWLLEQGFSNTPSTMLILTDDQSSPSFVPTKSNIMRGLQWLVEGASPGDSLFFHFSGHGSQQADPSGAERDGLNETICPVDMKRSGMISDDVIWDILVYSLPDGCRLTALMDCCHSGTGMDLSFSFQGQWREEVNPSHAKGDVVLLSGCEDAQCSVDTYDKHKGAGGAMTNAFLNAHKKVQFPTYAQLLSEINSELRRKRYSQRPKLSSSQAFNVHERIFELSEGFQMNSNRQVGRQVTRRFKPKTDFSSSFGGMGGMGGLLLGAALGAAFLD